MSCHCGNQTDYSQCCEPLILGKQNPATAEALMRSRYTAHVVGAVRYLHDSLTKGARKNFDEAGTRKWSADAEWLGLEILSTTAGQVTDTEGTVSFLAKYKMGPKTNRQLIEHHETSTFVRETTDAVWKFSSGKVTGQADEEESAPVVREPAVRDPSKVGRNDPCPCGSGKKYKKCHAQLSA